MKKVLLVTVLIFLSKSIYSQVDKIDSFIKSLMQKEGIPGLHIAIVQKGEIIKCFVKKKLTKAFILILKREGKDVRKLYIIS